MNTIREQRAFNSPALVGTLLFLIAIAFYYFSVLKTDYQRSSLLNLAPYPDATEYFAQAKAMENGRRPDIQIGFEHLPSAFPPGYSALMLPWLKILPPEEDVLAPFRTNQTIGLIMLLVVFCFYLYLAMPLAGGVASILLATLPGFFTFCRSSLSDSSAWLFYVLAFMFAYLGVQEQRRWKVYLSAVFLGLSLNIRLQSVFFLPLMSAMMLFPYKQARWRWFLNCAAMPLVVLLAAAPFFVVNALEFHSPLQIGGNFWYPPRQLFSFGFIPTKNLAMFWRELTLRPHGFFAAHIFGTGTVFVPAFVLLLIAGLFVLRMHKGLICLLLADAGFFFATASYLYPDGRYYLQLLILLIPLAVLGTVWAINNLIGRRRIFPSLIIILLFIASCLGYPSTTGYKAKKADRFQAWDAIHYHSWHAGSVWLVAERSFAGQFGRKPGIVLSDIDSVYLNALFPTSLVAAPIDDKHKRRWSPKWHYGQEQAESLIKKSQGVPVYALFLSDKEIKEARSRLPQIPDTFWTEIPSPRGTAVLQLVPTRGSVRCQPPFEMRSSSRTANPATADT